jgi:superkiller protein 3
LSAIILFFISLGVAVGSMQVFAAKAPVEGPVAVQSNDVQLGDAAYKAGKFDDAIERYESALARDPESLDLLVRIGKAHALAGRPEQAEPFYSRALARDPGCVDAHYGLGILYEGKDPGKTVEHFKVVFAAQPDNADVKLRLGFALLNAGKMAEGTALFERWFEADPTAEAPADALRKIYDAQGETSKAEGLLKKHVAARPDSLNAARNLAEFYDRYYTQAGAIAVYQEFMKRNPENRDGPNALAGYYHSQGMWDDAVRIYKEMVKENPGDERARTNLINTYRDSGQFDKALAEVEAWTKDDPKAETAYRQMSLVFREQKKYDLAILAQEKLKAVNPKDSAPYLAIAEIYVEMGQPDKALDELKTASDALPHDLAPRMKRLQMYEERKDYASALELIQEIAKIQPHNIDFLMNGPRYLLLMGKTEEAIAGYKGLIEKSPYDQRLYVRLAEAHEQAGQLDKALEVYEHIRQTGTGPVNEAWYRSRAASIYARQGKPEEAVAGYKWVVERFPETDKHYFEIVKLEKARGAVDEAIAYLKDRAINGAERESVVETLISAYGDKGLEPAEVAAELRGLHQARPKSAAIVKQTAEYCLKNGLDKEAAAAIESLLGVDPGAAEWRIQLGRLYAASGENEKAIEQLERSLAKTAQDAEVYLLLGQVFEKLGKKDQAVEAYGKAVEGDNLEAKKALDWLLGAKAGTTGG